jgi:retinol dehydrogenase 12
MTCAVHPGLVATELGRHVHHPQQQQRKNKSFTRRVISALSKTPSQGAQTSIYCALEPSLNHHSGCYYR